jgi:hypothetical protein
MSWRGEPIRDDSFLLLFNASGLELDFALPSAHYGVLWTKVLDTAVPVISAPDLTIVKPGDLVTVPGRSLQVLHATETGSASLRPANADAPGPDAGPPRLRHRHAQDHDLQPER